MSNSFAEPLTTKELVDWTLEQQPGGGKDLVDEYYNHRLTYTPNGGSLDLRQAIAQLYGPCITASHILVFPGAQVALQTAARTVVGMTTTHCANDSNDNKNAFSAPPTPSPCHAITFTPGYQSVQEGPAQAGASSVTKITLRPANGWQIDVPEVEAAILPSTRYIVINEPYNPAGTLMSRETQTQLIALAAKHNIYILCDEVYRLLEHDDKDRIPAMADAYGSRGLSCVTLSKPWGGCGITIGWIACQNEALLDRMTDWQYFGTTCPGRASELLAIMTLRNSERILERNRKIIRRNKRLLEQFMSDYSDWFDWVPPTAGAICALRFHGPLTTTELGEALAAFEGGIGIKPSYCFTDKQQPLTKENDYFRVGFGESIMPESLEALRRFVAAHKEDWKKEMAKNKM